MPLKRVKNIPNKFRKPLPKGRKPINPRRQGHQPTDPLAEPGDNDHLDDDDDPSWDAHKRE